MSRNNDQNAKKHNDKLHKAKAKAVKQKVERKAQLKAILKKFNSEQKPE
jgi:hypothetical protein